MLPELYPSLDESWGSGHNFRRLLAWLRLLLLRILIALNLPAQPSGDEMELPVYIPPFGSPSAQSL